MKITVSTSEAPRAIGPYSQGIKAGGFVFVSGQVAIDPATGKARLGNGGGGLVAARHLRNHAVDVSVVLSSSDRMGEVPRHQLDIVKRMGIAVTEKPPASALVIDAILGYSLQGDPRGRAAELIRWCLHQTAPVCSLDTPSGLDVTTGEPRTPCVRATATLTLALPKVGLAKAPSYVGELYLADISVPPFVHERIGIHVPPDLFAADAVVRVR